MSFAAVRRWLPEASADAALRGVRAMIVVPGLFALTHEVIGDLQMATFAAFGGFATLVMTTFGGTRRQRAAAHLGLAAAGSVLLVIGTAVNASPALAIGVTIPVAFAVLFAGVAGPNAAAGGTGALLAYILPAASPGTIDMIPSRLAGWWLASVAGTAAVLLLSAARPERRLTEAAVACARALAAQLSAALHGDDDRALRRRSIAARDELMSEFTATPYRPTGLTTTEQALDNLVVLLEWCASVVCESIAEYRDLRAAPQVDRHLLAAARDALDEIAGVLDGGPAGLDLVRLETCLAESVASLRERGAVGRAYRDAVHLSFHARTIALASQRAAQDALIVAGRAAPQVVAGSRRRWHGLAGDARPGAAWPGAARLGAASPAAARLGALLGAARVAARHASVRSVWFLNSVRGSAALATAVAAAGLTGVQHGFWVVLGTLSVLRTSAAQTGATALHALLGTVGGFVVGALLILSIGTGPGALWAALPVAVFVAAYAPGAAPFAAGQAAFTVAVSVLYNLLAPAGWKVGVIRVEDVAIGCAVSLVVGTLFWPRGASGVVGDALADAFRRGAAYLVQTVDWTLGLRRRPPVASGAVAAGLRLDDALRGFLAEQGAKRVPKEDLWKLVGGTLRLRLTALSLAGLPNPRVPPDTPGLLLAAQAKELAGWYDQVAEHVSRRGARSAAPLESPSVLALDRARAALGSSPQRMAYTLWIEQHLLHITPYLDDLVEPAERIARQRRIPWWR